MHDVVVFYVSAVGTSGGELVQRSFVKKIRGGTVEGRHLSAIQLSTAAGVVALLELFARGAVAKSFVRQESIHVRRVPVDSVGRAGIRRRRSRLQR